MPEAQSQSALAGLQVLDLTQFLSGPYCTQILADLGAQVIKVESPEGDLARYLPPHFVGEDSVYFLSVNRTKRSIAVDMKTQAGRDLVRRLALQCDVVIENFRPGVLQRLGLSAETIRAERPDVIWCSISGFGQDGPYRDLPAYDMIVQALSGGMSLTGEPDGRPVRAGIPLGDLAAGMYAAIGVLAALERRRRTGRGDLVDVSMLDCQVSMLTYQMAYHLHAGVVPGPQGRGHDSIPTYRSFTARDGMDVVITANTERMWQSLARVVGLPELLDDPRFATNKERHRNRAVLWPILEAAFRRGTADEWVERLRAEQVPVAVANTLDRVAVDPQVHHRGLVVETVGSDGARTRAIGTPLRFAETPAAVPIFPPMLGEHNEAVLRDLLGATPEEIAELVATGVLATSRKDEQANPARIA